MKKFSTIAEFRKYYAKKSLASYHRTMSDPVKADAYRAKRRVYERARYKEMMEELRNRAV